MEGNDLDGDKLNYAVIFSSDNGGNWTTLAQDLNQTEYIWNTTYLLPSDQCRIRVFANDGFNTAVDDSVGIFRLSAGLKPVLLIGLINSSIPDGDFTWLIPEKMLFLRVNPFAFKVYSPKELVIISNDYKGFVGRRFIIGLFNAVVPSETIGPYHPFRDRLKQLITPQS